MNLEGWPDGGRASPAARPVQVNAAEAFVRDWETTNAFW
jgi:hypothetical protein